MRLSRRRWWGWKVLIKSEVVTIGGKQCVRTYSDAGMMIERDGALYEEAIDPAELGRVYTETEVESADLDGEAETADYLAALNKLGVSQ